MTTTQPIIAVLGTGIIGAPVARNLSRSGFTVRRGTAVGTRSRRWPPTGCTPLPPRPRRSRARTSS